MLVGKSRNVFLYVFLYKHTDIEAPTFDECPADIVAYTERGLNQTNVQWFVQASDNSGSDPHVTCDLNAGVMTSGTHTVTCTARDGTGNENICRFLINVIGEFYTLNFTLIHKRIPQLLLLSNCTWEAKKQLTVELFHCKVVQSLP